MSIASPVTLADATLLAAATTQSSTTLPAEVDPSLWAQLGQIAPMALGALLLATWAGVFRRRSVVGPERLAPGESPATLLMAMLLAFVAWVTIPSFYATQAPNMPSTTPVTPEITPAMLRVAVITSTAALLLMLAASAFLRPAGLKLLGLHPSQILPGLATGILGALILLGLVFFASALTEILWQALNYQHPREHELLRVLHERRGERGTALLLLASAWVVAPLFEEVFFRGHLQTAIVYALHFLTHRQSLMGRGFEVISPGAAPVDLAPQEQPTALEPPSAAARWTGIVIASLLFSAVHAGWMAPPIFVLSLCVGYAYERTGNLWTPITMHATFNITSTLIFLKIGGG